MRLTMLLLAALVAVSCAFATPSTLIWIPSTDVQADRTWHLGVDSYFDPGGGYRSPTDVGLTYGCASGRAEIGLDYLGGQDDPFFVNGKYLLCPESGDTPAVAVGLYNFGTRSDSTDYNMVYALAAKSFSHCRLTAGYCHGKERTLGSDGDMLLLGLDGYLSADRKWWGAVDYQSGDNAFGALSFGVAYSFAPNVSVILGYDVYGAAGADDTLTTQLDINF